MKRGRLSLAVGVAVALASPVLCQQQTVARLAPESHADIIRTDISRGMQPAENSVALHVSATSRAAADALFVMSDVRRGGALADRALRRNPQDAEALFVRMELAASGGDYEATLDGALRLCEAGAYARGDLRVRLAAARVRESAANTTEFKRAIPRLQSLLANTQRPWLDLEMALLNAAMDGAPGLDAYAVARSAGILTDWRIVGPIGARPLLDLDRQVISPADDLTRELYAGRAVENFQFIDGWLRLPEYLQRRGVFYAAARFASLAAETRELRVETGSVLDVYVDGARVLRTDAARQPEIVRFKVMPGPHRVLLKFSAPAAPLRVTLTGDNEAAPAPQRPHTSPQETVYLLAAEHYADGEFGAAAKQIEVETASDPPAMLRFLREQALTMSAAKSRDSATSPWWNALNIHQDLVATDLSSGWAHRLAEHPSCEALTEALEFYGSQGLNVKRNAAQQRLDGCAPESLAYAQSLSQDGRHQEAAQALRRLLAGAPLNREARLMLISELQIAGDDSGAQRAAADWLSIAPNAPNYHRLAVTSTDAGDAQRSPGWDFYLPYRRDAAQIAHKVAAGASQSASVELLDDHVAIARPDGSVSLYVHTARRWPLNGTVGGVALAQIPSQAQVLGLRVLHIDGTTTELAHSVSLSGVAILPGDTLDAEYVLNFTGDGGIPEHAQAFQFTFGSFDEQVLNARFVVLTPADHGDGGVVIATGGPPVVKASVRDGMLVRVWEKNTPEGLSSANRNGLAIVRVVERENGWSVPSSAEHKKKIETIHPGPLPEDS